MSLKRILEKYELASGQAINLSKSEILFSRNVQQDIRGSIYYILGIRETLGVGKYLGLQSLIDRNKKEAFNFGKEQIWKRISSWKRKTRSMAGRGILIKSVAQAIPAYCISMYLIPPSLGDEIQRMLNSFWWGSNNNDSKGIKWLDWDKLTVPKTFGGLGFRHIYAFNLAMLCKQAWRFIDQPNALVSWLYRAKYFSHGDFFEANLGHNPSYAPKSILSSKVVLKAGVRWSLGDGTQVPVWGAPWLRSGHILQCPPQYVEQLSNLCVRDLWLPDKKAWNEQMI